jgi:hypothetical protein
MSRFTSEYEKSLSRWDDEITRDNKWWIIGLEFSKKKINYYYSNRVELWAEPIQLKLNPFNYRAWLARARVEFELSHEPELYCAALDDSILHALVSVGRLALDL